MGLKGKEALDLKFYSYMDKTLAKARTPLLIMMSMMKIVQINMLFLIRSRF